MTVDRLSFVRRPLAVAAVCAALIAWPSAFGPRDPRDPLDPRLRADAGQALRAAELWLAPDEATIERRAPLAAALRDLGGGRAGAALPVLAAASNDATLGRYAQVAAGRAQLALRRPADALATGQRVLDGSPTGYVEEAALLLIADAAMAASDPARAQRALQRLTGLPAPTLAPARMQWRIGQAALAAGDRAAAVAAFTHLYFEHSPSPEAGQAAIELKKLSALPSASAKATYARALARAERLFAGRQYADARAMYVGLKTIAPAGDRPLVDLRLAACDFFVKRYAAAQTALRLQLDRPNPLAAEAEFYYLSTLRELGRTQDYLRLVRAFVDRHADSPLAERALNELGTFHILADEDETAAGVFAELYRRFPTGAFAERAAWKAGWWAYTSGDYAEAVGIFESASVGLRRADFRPAWLYWAARSRAHMAQGEAALAAYDRAIGDYRNTYYGREAMRASDRLDAVYRPAGAGPVARASLDAAPSIAIGPRPANATLIQHLLAAGMFDEAIGELRVLQATAGHSPLFEATIALALSRQGKLRPAIQTMRRAYPQFMAAGGERLPREILTVIFPVDHWPLIQRHAAAKGIDRHLLAALIAQESTFQADVRSPANAWGLMQIIPATGRRYASRLGIRPFSNRRLTEPDVNMRIGTTFFADLLAQFGDPAPALAGYNAGPGNAARWLAERPVDPRDEFVDDISYPETQHYVKRILGTAEDYRQLYR